MVKLRLSLHEAAYMIAIMEQPKVQEVYEKLVKDFMSISGCEEREAKAKIFPSFVAACQEIAGKNLKEKAT